MIDSKYSEDNWRFIAKEHDGPISVNVSYKQYTVKFYGFDNQLIKEEVVNAGSDAVAPIAPVVEGYDFINWDKDFSKVQSDLTVRANYAIKTFTVTFTSDDTVQIVGSKTATVNYGTKFDDLPFPEVTSSSNSISDIGWEIQSGSYDPEKGVCSDITVVVTYKVVIGPDLPDDDYTLGDVNNDGYVDNIDAAIILKHDAGLVDINNYLQFAGDVNNDGYIDNIDAALILKLDAGLIEGF